MSHTLETLRNKPVGLWPLDGNLTDMSGYGRDATGTPTYQIGFVSGNRQAAVFTNTVRGTFPTPVFIRGMENQTFTLSAWARVISADDTYGEQQVIGHSDVMDGLLINGTIVSFILKFATAPPAVVSHDLQIARAVNVIAEYGRERISLYIDGTMVGELTLTDEQKNDIFLSTATDLSSGASSSTQKIALCGLGVYGLTLPAESIERIVEQGRRAADGDEVPNMFDGAKISLAQSLSDVFLDQIWSSAADWSAAVLNNVVIQNNQLRPTLSQGLSLAGEWLDSFALDSSGVTSIFGVNVTWDGIGAVVEASLDGMTWEAAARGTNVSLIAPGFNPTGKELQLRISFPGGVIDDSSYVDNLHVVGFITGTISIQDWRTIDFTEPAFQNHEYIPLELRDNWGVFIDGGVINIGPDISEENEPIGVGEFWIKRTSATVPTISPAGTVYVNGVAASLSTIPRGHWAVVHVVNNPAITTSVEISGQAIVGQAAVYEDILTASQINNIVAAYTGTLGVRIDDDSVVAVTEPLTSAKIYAHDWAITAAG